ncbi:MAG: GTPase Era [Clostridiaceae bacterium]|nr:GTPase Era [Clostridiaceae bacterium]
MTTKAGVFSIVGRPNAGKSTLVNTLCGAKIAIVSDKPQTTRTRITGVLNDGDYQMIFLDTPGLHKPRNRLGDFMVKVVRDTVAEVDAAVLLVEPVARIGIPEQALIDRIRESGVPAILVINKVDMLTQHDALLPVISAYAESYPWEAVIPLSAKSGEGIPALLEELKKLCTDSPQLFPDGMISDQPERARVAEIIREKILENLEKEIPHGVAVEIEGYKTREDGLLDVSATIYCERSSHKGILIGKGGAMLKRIGASARHELEEEFDQKVFLQLWVKVREDWRNNPAQIRNFGYDDTQ